MNPRIENQCFEAKSNDLEEKPKEKSSTEESVDFSVFKEEFSWDRCPADLNLARKHGIASRIGKVTVDINKINRRQICECCFFPIINQEFPLCCERESLAYLGPGIPLYLEMVYLSFSILFALCVLSASPTIILNELHYAVDGEEKDLLRRFSMLSSQAKENFDYRVYTNFITISVIVLLLRIIDKKQANTLRNCDARALSPSDFTLMVMGLAPNEYSLGEVEELIMNKISETDLGSSLLRVEKIVMAHDIRLKIKEFQKMSEKQVSLKKEAIRGAKKEKRRSLLNFGLQKKPTLMHLASDGKAIEMDSLFNPIKIKAVEKNNSSYSGSIECRGSPVHKNSPQRSPSDSFEFVTRPRQKDTSLSRVLFITLNRQEGVEIFERKHRLSTIGWLFRKLLLRFGIKVGANSVILKKSLLNIKRAPEPSDIIWENLSLPVYDMILRRIKGYSLTFFMLCLSLILVITCTYVEVMYEASERSEDHLFIRILIKSAKSLVIFVGNEAIYSILEKVTIYEKHKSLTSLKASYCNKIVKVQYLNTIFLIPLSRVFIFRVSTSKDSEELKDELILDLWILFLVLAFLQPVLKLFDPRMMRKAIKRVRLSRSKDNCLTQREANWIFQGLPVDLPRNYGQFLLLLFFTFFYSGLIPMMSFLSAAGLLLLYAASKYEILRRNSRPVYLGPHMNIAIMKYLDFIPLQFILAEIFFSEVLLQQQFNIRRSTLNFICLALALFLKIFPWKIFSIKKATPARRKSIKNMAETEYSHVCLEFENDYDRANPMTKKLAINRWVRELDKKRATMLSFGKRRNELEKIVKLSNYGKMMSGLCCSQDESIKIYAQEGLKIKLSQNTTEAMHKYLLKSALMTTKTLKELEEKEQEQVEDSTVSAEEIRLTVRDKIRALDSNPSNPKFFEPLDSLRVSKSENN